MLVIQTAFLGDVILALPVASAIASRSPGARVDFLVAPRGAAVLAGHPRLRDTIVYDKRGADRGAGGFLRILREVKRRKYACAVVPHRSLRSALLAAAAGIPVRAGFDASAGRWFFTHVARYDRNAHEIDRNLRLLGAIAPGPPGERPTPRLQPSAGDAADVDRFLRSRGTADAAAMVAVAPGTAWNTKRWPAEKYGELVRLLDAAGFRPVLVGGREDTDLCRGIAAAARPGAVLDACGAFSPLGSAELLRRCVLLVCNDSAPMHLAGAVGTPVVAIFGATSPSFGFGPTGPGDRVIETAGLGCRPCSIHGGERCPVGTFECMERITPREVLAAVVSAAGAGGTGR